MASMKNARAFSGAKSKLPISAPAQNALPPAPVMMLTHTWSVAIGPLQAIEDAGANAGGQCVQLVRFVKRQDRDLALDVVVHASQS
ncbi:hypothetical protein [Bradyrhizobium sp. USDA 4011]